MPIESLKPRPSNTMNVMTESTQENNLLFPISHESDGLIINPTSGTRTFVTERAMFPGHFDKDFEAFGTNVPSGSTSAIIPVVCEIDQNRRMQIILASLGENLWESQDPILAFIEKYPNWLHPDDLNTFFPFIVGRKKFVADVGPHRFKIGAIIYPSDYNDLLMVRESPRFVLPQLAQ